MSLREHLDQIRREGSLIEIQRQISKHLALSGLLKALEPAPVLCTEVIESHFPVIGNLFCSKETFADYLGIPVQRCVHNCICIKYNKEK